MKKKILIFVIILFVGIATLYCNKNIFKIWNDGSLTVSVYKGVLVKNLKIEIGCLMDSSLYINDFSLFKNNKTLFNGKQIANVPFLGSNYFFIVTLDDKYYSLHFIDHDFGHGISNGNVFEKNKYAITVYYRDSFPCVRLEGQGRGAGMYDGPMAEIRFADLQKYNRPLNRNALEQMKKLRFQ